MFSSSFATVGEEISGMSFSGGGDGGVTIIFGRVSSSSFTTMGEGISSFMEKNFGVFSSPAWKGDGGVMMMVGTTMCILSGDGKVNRLSNFVGDGSKRLSPGAGGGDPGVIKVGTAPSFTSAGDGTLSNADADPDPADLLDCGVRQSLSFASLLACGGDTCSKGAFSSAAAIFSVAATGDVEITVGDIAEAVYC